MKTVKKLKVEELHSFPEKLKGLLYTKPNEYTYAFYNCNSVHTHGMKHKLDIAFIDAEGRVIQVCNRVPSGLKIKCKKASVTLERFSEMHRAGWIKKGDLVELQENEHYFVLTI